MTTTASPSSASSQPSTAVPTPSASVQTPSTLSSNGYGIGNGNGNGKRKRLLLGMTGALVVIAVGVALWWWFIGSRIEGTDDAYVQGHVVQVTPQVGGTVQSVFADDTNQVKAGQLLMQLDNRDARLALDQARAQLAQTVREVRTLYANNGALKASVDARVADLARVESDIAKTQDDLRRREPLLESGAVSKEDVQHIRAQLQVLARTQTSAQAALAASREQLSANQSLTDGVDVAQHPNVQRAVARVHEAMLALARTEVRAPTDGFVVKRSVQVGARVAAGQTMMAVGSLDQLWVEANFKEVQLRKLRLGQAVTLTSDAWGKKQVYHGRIAGFAVGTGSAFALLPAQNATGNWIKVVQRLPVRVALDANELRDHPLRIGLSMNVEVHLDQALDDHVALTEAPEQGAVDTKADQAMDARFEEEVQRIIAANLGRSLQSLPVRGTRP